MRIKVIWTALSPFKINGIEYPVGDYTGEIATMGGVASKENGPLASVDYLTPPQGGKFDISSLVADHLIIRKQL